jgi:hypothetical protein
LPDGFGDGRADDEGASQAGGKPENEGAEMATKKLKKGKKLEETKPLRRK